MDTEKQQLIQLTIDLMEVVTDFLPNIGHCVLQDYWLLNDAMVRAEYVQRRFPHIKKSTLKGREDTPTE